MICFDSDIYSGLYYIIIVMYVYNLIFCFNESTRER